jgi:hypothetical protein
MALNIPRFEGVGFSFPEGDTNLLTRSETRLLSRSWWGERGSRRSHWPLLKPETGLWQYCETLFS